MVLAAILMVFSNRAFDGTQFLTTVHLSFPSFCERAGEFWNSRVLNVSNVQLFQLILCVFKFKNKMGGN